MLDSKVRLQFLSYALNNPGGGLFYQEALPLVPTALQEHLANSDRFMGEAVDKTSATAGLESRIDTLKQQALAETERNNGQWKLVKGLDKMLNEIRTMPITAQQKSDLALKGLESLVEVDSRWFSLGHRTAGFFNLSRISRRSTFKRVVNNLLRHV